MIHAARKRPSDRKPTQSAKQPTAQPVAMPAPTNGLVNGRNIVVGSELSASVSENFFPTLQGSRVRGGKTKVANISGPVTSMFAYRSGTAAKLFATTGSAIFDITALDPNSVPTAAVSGQTSGVYASEQFSTVAGEYLYAVNGSDLAQLFDGATWLAVDGSSSPAITGIATSKFSHVWKHKNRIWFVEGGTKRAHYLPVDSVGGAITTHSLEGVFRKGGSLLFGGTWSSDSGSGMDDRCVFVSDQGEVAIYQGSDPSNASTWSLVGVYSITEPLGVNCHFDAGR